MLSSSISPTEGQLHNPFDDEASVALIEPDIDLTGQSTTKPTEPQNVSPTVTGNIGSINNISQQQQQQQQYEDTLDEPVSVTIMRDVKKVANKSLQVLHPNGDRNVLRDWDLWGPLIFCLILAIVLSVEAPKEQAMPIFTGVFVIVWAGAAVVTVNAQLLGGAVSFFQSVCVIGYCLFPIVASAIIALFVKFIWIRLPIAIVSFAWSTYASVGFMSETQIHLQNRRALAVYPLFLFYFVITWLVLIS
ncbi:Yip1-domain-containing protein [Rhizopus microsporus var. microsporus]|uniref:Protein YIP n=1 Tax=Rhizopus microsporus var. microsporus TaxID=86635 RepID=A0A1X0RF27_RHIZD|nr:Yip1-domain-containing protein [Rhizopus microsporus var. microsporus]